MLNALTSAGFVAILVALALWARPRQPQWVSRDGTRFIAMACKIDVGSGRPGRWTRVHGRINGDRVTLRQSFLATSVISGSYRMAEREESTDARFAVYTFGETDQVHVKVSSRSPLVATFESMLPRA